MSIDKTECVSHNDKVNPVADSYATTPETEDRNSGSTDCSFSAISNWRKAIYKHRDETEQTQLLIDPSRIVGFSMEHGTVYVILDSGKTISVLFQSCEEAAAALIC